MSYNNSNKTFKDWLSVYQEGQELDALSQTNVNWRTFAKGVLTEDDDDHKVETLISFPTAAFFYGFRNEKGTIDVEVVHHISKDALPGLTFDSN